MKISKYILVGVFLSGVTVLFSCTSMTWKNGDRTVAQSQPWRFAISGDSRNCGNVVMPAIAKGALADNAKFYLHLGDFRALRMIDEDFAADPARKGKKIEMPEYLATAWQDYIDNQMAPFGSLPVFLALGNHELYGKTREEYNATFKSWLNMPPIQAARIRDGAPGDAASSYYHWNDGAIDFIVLDNGTPEQFDQAQMAWFHQVMANDEKTDSGIKTIILAMHEALPDSISFDHSMSESNDPNAISSGREVYKEMLKARDQAHKQVYILASHSHFFMDGTFNTAYWRENGGVLPGWIVGTAGAERKSLPPDSKNAIKAIEKTYGYLLATVDPSTWSIQFDFKPLQQSDIPQSVVDKYGSDLVDFCFNKNYRPPKPKPQEKP